MKLPSRIRICRNVFYRLVYQDEIDGNPDVLGLCDPNMRTIFIKTNLSDRLVLQTLIHELIHAIEFEYQQPIPHRITYTLDEGLAAILRLNKMVGFKKSRRHLAAQAKRPRAKKARR